MAQNNATDDSDEEDAFVCFTEEDMGKRFPERYRN